MKVFITGNLGYIGPILIRHLKEAYSNIQLFGFDTGYFATSLIENEYLPEIYLDAQYFGDVRRFPENLLEGMDAVIYLSAISNDPMGKTFEKVTYDINADSAIQFASKAKARGVSRFIFASSCSIYGYAEGEARDENSSLNPLTAYAISKVNAEKGLQPLADNNFIITAHRFATACGYSPRLRLDLVLNDFVASAITTQKIEILSDGTPWRPLIHVKDMARAMEWSLLRTKEQGGTFLAINTGSNAWNYQVKELAEAVAKIISGTSISINPNAQPDKRSYKVSFNQFEKLAPNHKPKLSLEEAIQDLYEGLKKANFQDKNFRQSIYMRLNKLNQLKNSGKLNEELYWR